MDKVRNESRNTIEKLEQDLQEQSANTQLMQQELGANLKEKEDEIKTLKIRFEKEVAIFKQKIEFQDVQNQQMKGQLDETKRAND